MPITVQVIDVIININSSSSWALVLCTCCTIHCYATAKTSSQTRNVGVIWSAADDAASPRFLSLLNLF